MGRIKTGQGCLPHDEAGGEQYIDSVVGILYCLSSRYVEQRRCQPEFPMYSGLSPAYTDTAHGLGSPFCRTMEVFLSLFLWRADILTFLSAATYEQSSRAAVPYWLSSSTCVSIFLSTIFLSSLLCPQRSLAQTLRNSVRHSIADNPERDRKIIDRNIPAHRPSRHVI